MLTIFDFDGTIADTLEAAIQIYGELSAIHGLPPLDPSEFPKLRDMGAKQVIEHFGISKLKVPSLLLQGRSRMRSRINELPLIPGMFDAIHGLRENKVRLGILTSNSADNVEAFLKHHQLDGLFEFISSTSKLSGKDKHLRSIARTFSLPSSSILYIGDEIRDIRAAKKANTRSAAVTWGFNSPQSLRLENPDYLIDSPAQLLEI